jgi:hypothetical protein
MSWANDIACWMIVECPLSNATCCRSTGFGGVWKVAGQIVNHGPPDGVPVHDVHRCRFQGHTAFFHIIIGPRTCGPCPLHCQLGRASFSTSIFHDLIVALSHHLYVFTNSEHCLPVTKNSHQSPLGIGSSQGIMATPVPFLGFCKRMVVASPALFVGVGTCLCCVCLLQLV